MSLLRRVSFTHSVASVAVLLFLSSTLSYAAGVDEVKFVDVDGVRTGYLEGGSGEAMVLVHGGHFGSAAHYSNNWRSIFDYPPRIFMCMRSTSSARAIPITLKGMLTTP